ncbi:hypothetical protein [Clostridium sp.]|uniref:hypothetical protein n=1 Tax=Clostridium sp. TaxID=1506 RepID=UPI00283F8733|nr:hypothetical protein [Clostridium sp.]MDR3598781.1 hypothetical protein [Clostridium sp.]
MEFTNIVSGFIVIPLFENQLIIEKNKTVRFLSFLYLVGLIDGCCQHFNISEKTFWKMYDHYFLYELKNSGYSFHKFSPLFSTQYDKMLDVPFIEKIITFGGQDIQVYLIKVNEGINPIPPETRLESLVQEWKNYTPDNATLTLINYYIPDF